MLTTFYTDTKSYGLRSIAIALLLSLSFLFSFLWSSAFAQTSDPGHARVIEVGVAVTLDGTGSTSSSGLGLSYAWTLTQQPAGSNATLTDANSPRPILTPDLAGDYRAELIVTDSDGNSSAAQTVLLTTSNVPPVPAAGADRFTTVGQSLWFDPEGTYDANGDRLDATWSISSRVASTQVRCAAGANFVSFTIRATVRCVRSRVDPPAP